MKKKEWNEGLNHIDPDLVTQYVEQKERLVKRSRTRAIWLRVGALAACLCLVVGGVLIPLLNKKDPLPDPTPDPTPDHIVPGGISFDSVQVPSSAPQYYGSNLSTGNGGMMGSMRRNIGHCQIQRSSSRHLYLLRRLETNRISAFENGNGKAPRGKRNDGGISLYRSR